MMLLPITVGLPAFSDERYALKFGDQINGIGDAALLERPLFGLIASRECPGRVLLETLESVPQWVKAGRVIVSGFHSPLEQQVLRSLLRRNGHAVRVLARCFSASGYRLAKEEQDAFANGRLLIISAFGADTPRVTRVSAIKRNELVIALSTEVVTPFISKGSPLEELLAKHKA
jgi:predicted Rossmann fold nucleotide-binding protein DprA/Smf involved in DNA uptake